MNLAKTILKRVGAKVLKRNDTTKYIFECKPTNKYRCVKNNLFFFGRKRQFL